MYHFPQLYLTELLASDAAAEGAATYWVSESAAAELKAEKQRTETARFRAAIEAMNTRAREDAMDQPPPATVRAHRAVYGHLISAAGRLHSAPVEICKVGGD